ncbi:MAG TPA: GPW/gp25 family protein [Allosphingosinicella sp.]|nr:GPW/gp25 family protein [Allosphingosinicella sp.]
MSGLDRLDMVFLGRGWAFPFRVEPANGRVATAADEEDIRQSILIILKTAKGERVMRPDFGCGIHNLVFAAIDTATLAQVKRDVADALRDYEARIVVTGVQARAGNLLNGQLIIEIDYRVRQTNQPGNLVFPFYFREGQ